MDIVQVFLLIKITPIAENLFRLILVTLVKINSFNNYK